MNDSTSDRHVPADTSVDPFDDVPRTAGQPFEQISSDELECYRDAEWAMHNPEVQRKYDGQWVVAYRRAIVAHGTDWAVASPQFFRGRDLVERDFAFHRGAVAGPVVFQEGGSVGAVGEGDVEDFGVFQAVADRVEQAQQEHQGKLVVVHVAN